MSAVQFWEEDVTLTVAYRKAHKLKQEMENQSAWLTGLYVYDALCCASPAINAFSKSRKPLPYPSQPYALGSSAEKHESAESKAYEKVKSKMEAFAAAFNKKFTEGRAKGD